MMQAPDQHTLVLSFNLRVGLIISGQIRDISRAREGFFRIMDRLGQILSATPHTCSFITEASREYELPLLQDYLTGHNANGTAFLKAYRADSGTSGDHLAAELELRQFFSLLPSLHLELSATSGADQESPAGAVDEAIIRDCDILILASNGRAEEDMETIHLLRFARMIGRSLFHIDGESGSILELRNNDRFLETLEHLNTYNREHVSDQVYESAIARYVHLISRKVIKSGIPPEIVRPLCQTMLPQFARAHQLAKAYHRRYLWAGNVVYGFSALAVLAVSLQVLFFPDDLRLIWVEVFAIAVILVFLIGAKIGEWHRKWIDYQFLAERLRTAFFLCITCIRCSTPEPLPYQTLAHRPNDWMVIAFEQIVEARPTDHCRLDVPFQPLRNFILDAWIDSRLTFYSRESERNSGLYHLTAHIGEALFFFTLVIAIVHASGMEHTGNLPFPASGQVLATLTLVLPVAGAAIAAIRVQREYLRNSERYTHIVRHLSSLRNQIHSAQNKGDLCRLLEEMNELTLREQQDWRIIFRFRDLEA